ncbi:MAG: PAS domain S-box protein [Mariprofundaceae bacterium]|nr:PAS domain S-box protein [Mariprofundaceae bacterium]
MDTACDKEKEQSLSYAEVTAMKNILASIRKSIFNELMVLVTIIIIPLSLALSAYVFSSFNQVTHQLQLASLGSLATAKANTINQYIDNHLNHTETLSMIPSTKMAFKGFDLSFQQGIDSKEYQRIQSTYDPFFRRYLAHWNYYDLFLIDAKGNIIYSIKHEKDFATNLHTGAYRNSDLSKVFQQSLNMLQSNNSTFSFYEPSQEAAAFVATPIIDQGKAIGVLALQFDTDAFYDVINNLIGLGQTGEIVIGQDFPDKVLLTAPLRHDPDAAFQRSISHSASNARPIREGSQGKTGSGIIIDWRGEEAIAVWQYIPSLKWGMVVKIDTEEAFNQWGYIEKNLIGLIGISLLLGSFLLYLFTRHVTKPLRQLTQISHDVAAGKQSVKVDGLLHINNEVGVLANAFSKMLQQSQHSKLALEDTVNRLAESNKTLDQRVKEQIEHIQAIVEYSSDGILTMDQHGEIQSLNPAICHIFNYEAHELLGQKITKLIPEEYRGQHQDALQQYQRNGQKTLNNQSLEIEGLRKSGEVFPIDLSINEMHVDSNMLYLGTIRDITNYNIKREKIEHTQRLESLGVLAGGIAHDFNNLLTVILGNAALAKIKMQNNQDADDLLNNIETASERAAALCKQMLAYSGKGKLVIENINLTTLLKEMVNLLEVSIQKKISIHLDLSEHLLPISADTAQIQQVIMNLVINASEAIDDKSGIITIHTELIDVDLSYIQSIYSQDDLQAGQYINIEVSDTGCGMDKKTQAHIFEPFFTTKFTGRGLGMSAILGIVRGHQGAIKVYSEKGKGTTFKILLPCSSESHHVIKTSHTEVIEYQERGTILVVDDEEGIREMAGMALKEAGFHIIYANDGTEGVKAFKKHQKDICAVLLDMTMPNLNGEEVFRAIKLIQTNIPVILSSGYNEQDATKRFIGKGLAGFIQKPYSPHALQKKVIDILKTGVTNFSE